MKLIDATHLILSADIENNKIHVKDIIRAPEIDPVHAVGGCYCKECLHSEPVEYKFADDWVVPIEEYWCNEHKITMPLNGFCSEGRKDKVNDSK